MKFEDKQIIEKFHKMYGKDVEALRKQKERYAKLENESLQKFDDTKKYFFSLPKRTEIGGNHTDHNHGKVITESVNLWRTRYS